MGVKFFVIFISIVLIEASYGKTTTTTDDSLFPISVTNPTATSTSTSTELPGIPSTSPITSIGNIGSSIGSSYFPSTGSNSTVTAAQVPNEFYCPLFESNPYDTIFKALDTLSSSMKVSTECQQQSNQYNDYTSDSEKIRNVVTQLKQLQADPNLLASTSSQDIERTIQDAVTGVTNIANNLSNNKLLNKNCTSSQTSIGKGLVAVSDIFSNLAPIGLAFAAVNPAVGIATKLALMGGVYASSAIKGFDQYIKANSIDISSSEVRKAVLQNTCQFVKVKQKIDFLQLGEDGRINDIEGNLFKNIEAFRARYNSSSSTLTSIMQYKYQTEKYVADVESKIADDKYNLNFYNAKVVAASEDKERICLVGSSMAKKSKDTETFPASVVRNLETAVEVSKLNTTSSSSDASTITTLGSGTVDPKVQAEYDELYLAFNKSRNRLGVLAAKAMGDSLDADKSVPLCAEETKIFVKRIYEIIVYSEKLVNQEIVEVEKQLSQNDEYKIWNAQYVKLKSEKSSLSRVVKVLKEMSRPDAVYIRSELDQRLQELKASLFRANTIFGVSTGKSPVYAWLDNNMDMHRTSLSKFTDILKLLQKGTFQLTKDNKTAVKNEPKKSAEEMDKALTQDLGSLSKLANLTIKALPSGSRQHEIACQQLQEGYLYYKASKDYLGSAQFMCDMIDPYVGDTSEQIIKICRGGKTFNSNVKSQIQERVDKMKNKTSASTLSVDDYGRLMNVKRGELKCPVASINVVD